MTSGESSNEKEFVNFRTYVRVQFSRFFDTAVLGATQAGGRARRRGCCRTTRLEARLFVDTYSTAMRDPALARNAYAIPSVRASAVSAYYTMQNISHGQKYG